MDALREYIRLFLIESKKEYDPEAWYYHAPPSIGLQTVIDRWQKQRPGKPKHGTEMPRQKVYDESMPIMVPVADLWPHREYTWYRETGRSGHAKGSDETLPGPEKWDAIKADMKKNGWDPDDPLQFYIGAEGGAKVGEGNHRLAIARELGINKVPVWFFFQNRRVEKSPQPPLPPAEKKKVDDFLEKEYGVKSRQKKKKHEPRTPEEQKRFDDLLADLMGSF